ncbi:uncharacterized protein OCT59_023092 [Rhizophagus irregularis]|uniref:Uncharacterized protein n=3 Tax=Rhizophagus irregularis TaxID=588596 RepID=A0A916E9L3_9GLOM|nr:hypothetical protein GLOIN_2v1495409 [Rhizophagus irregularis DAOM 181602=DAOM 197198]EXX52872.1 hypothetical protein RirG_249220 [Rhizophagus irregularis DAOM 197198w]UZO29628.1 hypothetical protein OCT59_023092 [Rhizophagus irregularis]POG82488.1 hypothetical protein GLOIN_2v1495409 [Rhizophagus irregularis DAOM 181602=DAOM 197198]CAB4396891.1 unnamed protein product [Rhizophagus irregularis]CAB4493908.1 unnamed protein product [Rhizophagus irregularis]|eukprot:XP_025189354.1 hypothetical protein GLOIN_2v1495409 [Rhizophagus irregularis DAOM 181602=DAOM 197198]
MLRSSRQQQAIEGKENAVTINITKSSQTAKTQGGNALRDLTNKTPHLKTVKFGDVDRKKVEKKKMKAKKMHDDDDVPDIEYCPPSIEEPPFEPDDEDLKINFEFFKHPLNFDVYEFENIIYEEPPMPKIDEKDLCYRKNMTEEELFGFDKLFINDII